MTLSLDINLIYSGGKQPPNTYHCWIDQESGKEISVFRYGNAAFISLSLSDKDNEDDEKILTNWYIPDYGLRDDWMLHTGDRK